MQLLLFFIGKDNYIFYLRKKKERAYVFIGRKKYSPRTFVCVFMESAMETKEKNPATTMLLATKFITEYFTHFKVDSENNLKPVRKKQVNIGCAGDKWIRSP